MRRSAFACVAFSLASSALAQEPIGGRTRPATPPRDGGVLHLATGTWTRKAHAASIGSDVIYDNTCPWAYFFPLSGDTLVTQGRVPSPTSPTNSFSRPGCATSYTIDGFQIAYCTNQTTLATYAVDFFETYVACSSVIGVLPTASYALSGLPHSTVAGVTTCWTVTIDLDAPPQVASLAFPMLADGDGTYSGTSNQNLFGWSMRCSLPWSQQAGTGPFYAGDESTCTMYDGTRWDSPVDYAEAGTGMGSVWQFWLEGGPSTPGCYFWPELPPPCFHLELYADACPQQSAGSAFCFGDGSGTACPCGNSSATNARAGCLNSLGLAGRLVANGYPRLSADSVVSTSDGLPPSASVLLFQGIFRQNGGAGSVFGDGLRCAGGSITRIALRAASASGLMQYPLGSEAPLSVRGNVTTPGTRTYQAWYRNSASFCTPSGFNFTNGFEIAWYL